MEEDIFDLEGFEHEHTEAFLPYIEANKKLTKAYYEYQQLLPEYNRIDPLETSTDDIWSGYYPSYSLMHNIIRNTKKRYSIFDKQVKKLDKLDDIKDFDKKVEKYNKIIAELNEQVEIRNADLKARNANKRAFLPLLEPLDGKAVKEQQIKITNKKEEIKEILSPFINFNSRINNPFAFIIRDPVLNATYNDYRKAKERYYMIIDIGTKAAKPIVFEGNSGSYRLDRDAYTRFVNELSKAGRIDYEKLNKNSDLLNVFIENTPGTSVSNFSSGAGKIEEIDRSSMVIPDYDYFEEGVLDDVPEGLKSFMNVNQAITEAYNGMEHLLPEYNRISTHSAELVERMNKAHVYVRRLYYPFKQNKIYDNSLSLDQNIIQNILTEYKNDLPEDLKTKLKEISNIENIDERISQFNNIVGEINKIVEPINANVISYLNAPIKDLNEDQHTESAIRTPITVTKLDAEEIKKKDSEIKKEAEKIETVAKPFLKKGKIKNIFEVITVDELNDENSVENKMLSFKDRNLVPFQVMMNKEDYNERYRHRTTVYFDGSKFIPLDKDTYKEYVKKLKESNERLLKPKKQNQPVEPTKSVETTEPAISTEPVEAEASIPAPPVINPNIINAAAKSAVNSVLAGKLNKLSNETKPNPVEAPAEPPVGNNTELSSTDVMEEETELSTPAASIAEIPAPPAISETSAASSDTSTDIAASNIPVEDVAAEGEGESLDSNNTSMEQISPAELKEQVIKKLDSLGISYSSDNINVIEEDGAFKLIINNQNEGTTLLGIGDETAILASIDLLEPVFNNETLKEKKIRLEDVLSSPGGGEELSLYSKKEDPTLTELISTINQTIEDSDLYTNYIESTKYDNDEVLVVSRYDDNGTLETISVSNKLEKEKAKSEGYLTEEERVKLSNTPLKVEEVNEIITKGNYKIVSLPIDLNAEHDESVPSFGIEYGPSLVHKRPLPSTTSNFFYDKKSGKIIPVDSTLDEKDLTALKNNETYEEITLADLPKRLENQSSVASTANSSGNANIGTDATAIESTSTSGSGSSSTSTNDTGTVTATNENNIETEPETLRERLKVAYDNLQEGDKNALMFQLAPAIYNTARGAFDKAEEYDAIYNPYASSALNDMLQRRFNIDRTPGRLQTRMAANQIQNNSVSNASRMANLANLAAGAKRQEDALSTQEATVNQVQMPAENAQFANQIGESIRASREQKRQLDEQAKAAKNTMLSAGLTQIGNVGQYYSNLLNKYREYEIAMNSINQMSPHYNIDSNANIDYVGNASYSPTTTISHDATIKEQQAKEAAAKKKAEEDAKAAGTTPDADVDTEKYGGYVNRYKQGGYTNVKYMKDDKDCDCCPEKKAIKDLKKLKSKLQKLKKL